MKMLNYLFITILLIMFGIGVAGAACNGCKFKQKMNSPNSTNEPTKVVYEILSSDDTLLTHHFAKEKKWITLKVLKRNDAGLKDNVCIDVKQHHNGVVMGDKLFCFDIEGIN